MATRAQEADPQRSVTDKRRRQRAIPSQTEPLPIFRQALRQTKLLGEPKASRERHYLAAAVFVHPSIFWTKAEGPPLR